jgi:hypothetical protein
MWTGAIESFASRIEVAHVWSASSIMQLWLLSCLLLSSLLKEQLRGQQKLQHALDYARITFLLSGIGR